MAHADWPDQTSEATWVPKSGLVVRLHLRGAQPAPTPETHHAACLKAETSGPSAELGALETRINAPQKPLSNKSEPKTSTDPQKPRPAPTYFNKFLESQLAVGIPGELDVRGRYVLLARQVDGSLVMFQSKAAIHLEIRSDALHRLEPEIIQRRTVLRH